MFKVLGPTSCIVSMFAGQAVAHAIIVDSTPAPLAHLAAGRLAVVLRYNSRIDSGRSKLLLQHGDVVERVPVSEAATPDVLQANIQVVPGAYELQWQVLATDGHVTRGRVPFTVDAGAQAAAK